MKERPQKVRVTGAARIDLSGGWSDTPPICYDRGGTVTVAGVTLNDVQPIEAVVERRETPGILVRSRDLGKQRLIESDAEIRDHSDPHDWCALVKSALAVTGRRFADGGLSITLSSDLPKGSGMGASSILGACLIAALDHISGRKYDILRIMNKTLDLEREMHTGGGWEDQMGALIPGIKILRTEKGRRQRPAWDTIKDVAPFNRLIDERGLLYFTGEKRMARNVLRGVIENYKADGDEGLARVAALRDGAEKCFQAIKNEAWDAFASCVNDYWMLKKAMDPGTTNERVEYIIARIAPWTSAVSLVGAGGGGVMFILAKNREAKQRMIKSLEAHPPVKRAKFYNFGVDVKGLEFHV